MSSDIYRTCCNCGTLFFRSKWRCPLCSEPVCVDGKKNEARIIKLEQAVVAINDALADLLQLQCGDEVTKLKQELRYDELSDEERAYKMGMLNAYERLLNKVAK